MTSNEIVRLSYAGAVGYLAVQSYGAWGFLIGFLTTVVANAIGYIFGRGTP